MPGWQHCADVGFFSAFFSSLLASRLSLPRAAAATRVEPANKGRKATNLGLLKAKQKQKDLIRDSKKVNIMLLM